MSTVTRPRGPLPARVYWVRRALVLAAAVLLVVGVAKLLGSTTGGDGADPPSARVVAAEESSTTPSPFSPSAAVPSAVVSPATPPASGAARPTRSPLAAPTGPCDDADVMVTPRVGEAVAGRDVAIALDITTVSAAACTWTVSPDTVALKITSGRDRIWTSQDCPSAVPTEQVVPRRARADTVTVVWNGRRSDRECSATTQWALRGWYHAEAVALGAEMPVDVQFELAAPPPRVVTQSPSPTPSPSPAASASPAPSASPAASPGRKPTPSPSPRRRR